MNSGEEFKKWLVWAEAQDIVEEVYTKPKAQWICGLKVNKQPYICGYVGK